MYKDIDPKISGWMFGDELEWLYTTAALMSSVLEVGSWMGKSSHALMSGCKGIVISVDHFLGTEGSREGVHAVAKTKDIANIWWEGMKGFPRFGVMKMSSEDAAAFIAPASIDMVFIDGDHTGKAFRKDLELWLPKAKKIICGHDYGSDIKKVVDELFPEVRKVAFSIWYVNLEKS